MNADDGLKDEFIRAHGYWSDDLARALKADRKFFAALLNFSASASRAGKLGAKIRDLILIALNASVTTLDEANVALHMKNALRNGATRAEILEVLQVVSVVGIHGYTMGAPILAEELKTAGIAYGTAAQKEKADHIKKQFTESRGYWSDLLEDMVSLAPDFFESYRVFSSVPWESGPLAPKIKELIYVAIDASTTHLYAPGTRIHVQNALRLGAEPDEIIEVFQLASAMGAQSWLTGVRLLEELCPSDES